MDSDDRKYSYNRRLQKKYSGAVSNRADLLSETSEQFTGWIGVPGYLNRDLANDKRRVKFFRIRTTLSTVAGPVGIPWPFFLKNIYIYIYILFIEEVFTGVLVVRNADLDGNALTLTRMKSP